MTDQNYFRPRPDERTYEEAMIKASYLVDNSYVKLTDAITYEKLTEALAQKIFREKTINKQLET